MALQLEPATHLTFARPFTSLTRDVLHLHNPHPSPVAFKVKTTAPKQYCVRPNAGRIEPGKSLDVQVILQMTRSDQEVEGKSRDKFLVQSVIITPAMETLSMAELWAAAENEARGTISEVKLRAVFVDAPQEAAPPSEDANDQHHTADESVYKPAESLSRGTARRSSQGFNEASAAEADSAPLLTARSDMPVAKPLSVNVTDMTNSPGSGKQAQQQIEVLTKSLRSQDRKIAQLEQELKRLKSEKPASGGYSQSPFDPNMGLAANDGISLQTVGIIALFAFLFGYLFF